MKSRRPPSCKYRPLADPSKSIRLLTLLPDRTKSRIRCKLTEVSFPAQESYTALSYEWGPEKRGHVILVNGRSLLIRKNLKAFLTRLRSELSGGQTLTLWVDAICIDQTSTSEKNDQVRMMGYIYSQAKHVVAWLGETQQIERLFRSIEDYCSKPVNPTTENLALSGYGQRERNLGTQAFVEYPEYSQDLATFYGAVYFQRSWIIQELLLATDLSMRCGSAILTHEYLTTLFKHIRFQRVMTGLSKVDYILSHYLDGKMDTIYEGKNTSSLSELVHNYAYTQCREPHDKIYAFIGVAKNLRANFDVDYRKPLHQLLIETCLYDLPQDQDLGFYIGLTHNLFYADLASCLTFMERAAWTAGFVDLCQQTLPSSLLSSKIGISATVIGRVASVNGSLALLDGRKPHPKESEEHISPVCHIVYGDPVHPGDLVCHIDSLCFIYRWCGLDLNYVSLGLGSGDPVGGFPPTSSEARNYREAVYASSSNIDTEIDFDMTTARYAGNKAKARHEYVGSGVGTSFHVSLLLSDFLIIFKAEFPAFGERGQLLGPWAQLPPHVTR